MASNTTQKIPVRVRVIAAASQAGQSPWATAGPVTLPRPPRARGEKHGNQGIYGPFVLRLRSSRPALPTPTDLVAGDMADGTGPHTGQLTKL
ncbi:Uncharacterised protein [Mycobacteroides abscessus subsp. abscessus]|nr:Uncharacterised protein [Mycobacteroides abscessus subsp. abscessus]